MKGESGCGERKGERPPGPLTCLPVARRGCGMWSAVLVGCGHPPAPFKGGVLHQEYYAEVPTTSFCPALSQSLLEGGRTLQMLQIKRGQKVTVSLVAWRMWPSSMR